MIGIFDSGLGGLTILKSILKTLPDYNYIYLGDNARTPYGSKSQEVIYNYTKQAIDFLFSHGCKLIIIACNTASSKALCKIQQEYLPTKYPNQAINVLGVVKPLVKEVIKNNKIQRVGILGTKATIESNVYPIEIKKLISSSPLCLSGRQESGVRVYQQSAPLLVPLIEDGWLKKPETKMILKKYLHLLKQKQVQILIPACTHYPFLLKDIERIMTKKCRVLNPSKIIASSLANYLTRHPEYEIKSVQNPKLEFYTTDDIVRFREMGEQFLGRKIDEIEKVIL